MVREEEGRFFSARDLQLHRRRALGPGRDHQVAPRDLTLALHDLTDGADRVDDGGPGRVVS